MQGKEIYKEIVHILVVACLVMLVAASGFAKVVTVEGEGENQKQAEFDAIRMAVEQAAAVMVGSQTLEENHVVVEDKIYSQARGFVNNYQVIGKKKLGNIWRVTVEADVDVNPNSKLMNALTREGIINTALRNPKIAVVISDDMAKGGKSAAEIAVTDAFLEAGFTQILNVAQVGSSRREIYNYGEDGLQELAARLHADVVVVGKVTTDRGGDMGQFIGNGHHGTGAISYRSQIDARMYMAQSRRVVAVSSKASGGVDISEHIAAKNAAANAGKLVGEDFVAKLIAQGAGMKQMLEVQVIANDFSRIGMIKKALEGVDGVKSVNLSRYANGEGQFSVQYSGAANNLFTALEKQAECFVKLVSVDYSTLKIQAY